MIEFGFPLQDKQLENRIREDQREKKKTKPKPTKHHNTTQNPKKSNKQEILRTRSQGSKQRQKTKDLPKPISFLPPEDTPRYLYFPFTSQILSTPHEMYLRDTFEKNYSYKSCNTSYKKRHKDEVYVLLEAGLISLVSLSPSGTPLL